MKASTLQYVSHYGLRPGYMIRDFIEYNEKANKYLVHRRL